MIELRNYFRKREKTPKDAAYEKYHQTKLPDHEMPVLQYRVSKVEETISLSGEPVSKCVWSEWKDVPNVYED